MEKEERNSLGQWSQNVIVADADYLDDVAFNLIVNFERMLGRMYRPGRRLAGRRQRWAADAGGAYPRQEARSARQLRACRLLERAQRQGLQRAARRICRQCLSRGECHDERRLPARRPVNDARRRCRPPHHGGAQC